MPAAIETYKLTKCYGRARGINNVTFSVPSGSACGFLGPNGAGKTTTIRCILGLLKPTSGEALLMGRPVRDASMRALVGSVAGDATLFLKKSGRWHIAFFEKLRRQKASAQAFELARRLELDLTRKVCQLSKGNRQKLALVLALMHDPSLLVLDEPTSGLDPLMQQVVFDILDERRASGSTLFISSHVLAEVERSCEQVVILREGQVVAREDVQSLMAKRLKTVALSFCETVTPEELGRIKGLSDVRFLSPTQLHCQVPGEALDELIGFVALHPVTDMEISHASLEDVFRGYYQTPDSLTATSPSFLMPQSRFSGKLTDEQRIVPAIPNTGGE